MYFQQHEQHSLLSSQELGMGSHCSSLRDYRSFEPRIALCWEHH